MKKQGLSLYVIASFVLATSLAAMGSTHAATEDGAAVVATFDVVGEQFRVCIENPATIAQVRALERGESTATIPNGRLLLGSDGNEPWSWHLDPNDIEMAEATIEVCDGTPSTVEGDLDRWIEEVGRYCPWSAELVSVEVVDPDGAPSATASSPMATPAAATAAPRLPESGGGGDGEFGLLSAALLALSVAGTALLAGSAFLAGRRS